MRVLLLAAHCNAGMSSTPFFGYKIVQALASKVDRLTLATQVRNRGDLDPRELGVDELEFLDTEAIARPFNQLARLLKRDANKAMTLGVALSYPSNLAFEFAVWGRFGSRIRAGEFELVHRVTPLSPTLPSPLESGPVRPRPDQRRSPMAAGLPG